MSTRNGSRPIEPKPARCACLVSAFLAGAVASAAVAAGSALVVVVGLVVAGMLALLAFLLHLVDAAPLLAPDVLPAPVRATAPRTAPPRLAEPGARAVCALCRDRPALLVDELCPACLSSVGLVELGDLPVSELARRLRERSVVVELDARRRAGRR